MLSDKRLSAIEKAIGKELLANYESMDVVALKSAIVQSEQAMKEVKSELEANPKYQELKEGLKAITAGLKEVNGRQRKIIEYCLHLLEDKSE